MDEDTIAKIICNTYGYVKKYIDPAAPGGKEHIGYIVDRTGFEEFKKWALEPFNRIMGWCWWKKHFKLSICGN